MKKYSIEFLGTFFLLLISALTENPIAIGLGLASLIYIGAHISCYKIINYYMLDPRTPLLLF